MRECPCKPVQPDLRVDPRLSAAATGGSTACGDGHLGHLEQDNQDILKQKREVYMSSTFLPVTNKKQVNSKIPAIAGVYYKVPTDKRVTKTAVHPRHTTAWALFFHIAIDMLFFSLALPGRSLRCVCASGTTHRCPVEGKQRSNITNVTNKQTIQIFYTNDSFKLAKE